MLSLLPNIITGLLGLGSKLILDKDKQAEFVFKVQEMAHELALKLLETKTYPWVDALVKVAYAGDTIIKGLIRPIVATGLFLWGILNPEDIIKLQQLGDVGQAAAYAVFGALPAWGVDRGLSKVRESKKKEKREELYSPFD